jgi:hypothetical protein
MDHVLTWSDNLINLLNEVLQMYYMYTTLCVLWVTVL